MPNKEEKDWIKLNSFDELPENGQREFFRHLLGKGKDLPEGKDMFSMDPNHKIMNPDAVMYQFWLQCEREYKFSDYFENFKKEQAIDKIPGVKKLACFEKNKDNENYLKEMQCITKQAKEFMNDLRKDVEHQLKTLFDEGFIKELKSRPDK